MINIKGFNHINIIVDEIDKAAAFYGKLFGAKKLRDFPHFKNAGFARTAGFLSNPEKLEINMRILLIPGANLKLELMQYFYPKNNNDLKCFNVNDLGGPRHLCLSITNIDEAFEYVKQCPGTKMVNSSDDYKPFKIDFITSNQFTFHNKDFENDPCKKEEMCNIIGNTKFFYFIDMYGVQWELEQEL